MVMIMLGTPDPRVCIGVPECLEARMGTYKDPNPFVCGECNQGHMNGYQFCPHNSAGLICATGIDVYSGACGDMHFRCP